MYKTVLFAALVVLAFVVFGCSSGTGNPVTPQATTDLTDHSGQSSQSQTHIWGYYDCTIDLESNTVEVIPNRNFMFTANVTNFVNGSPANLSFSINNTPIGTDYIDVDIDVAISHPFPGMTQYNGYDVRGVFMGYGSGTLAYNSDLDYPVLGPDQFMLENPDSPPNGAPDGYTRWYNMSEFGTPGLFGYTQGIYATPGYNGSATLCPYKYFANGLNTNDNLWEFLSSTDDNGVFAAGTTNRRNYYLRFPNAVGVTYGYAIIANWEAEDVHPSNAAEAVGCMTEVTPDIWYQDEMDKGGDLKLDLSLFNWNSQPDNIYVEGTVLSAPYQFDSTDLTPTDGGENWSTYHVEIDADNITGVDGQEYWVIAEYTASDYSNDMGVPNSAGDDMLAAFFRFDLYVSSIGYNAAPIINSGVDGEANPLITAEEDYTVDAIDPDGDPLLYDWVVTDDVGGIELEVNDDTTGMLTVDWGNDLASGTPHPDDVFHIDCEVNDTIEYVQATTLDITVSDYTNKGIVLREAEPWDLAVSHTDGSLLVLFTDGEVYKYTEAGLYLDGASHYTTDTDHEFIDIAPNNNSVVGGNETMGGYATGRAYLASGTSYYTLEWPTYYELGMREVLAFTSTTHNNWVGCAGFDASPASFRTRRYQPPTYPYNYNWHIINPSGYGTNTLHPDAFVSLECANTSQAYIYSLETDPEWRVEKYEYTSTTTILPTGVYWGGTQMDGTGGFNDPRDITRDDVNDYYILDVLSTSAPQVKKYEDDGTVIGTFGDATNIFGDPLRIEGSDYNGNIFVLSYNSVDNEALLSIFTPDDMD